MGVIKSRTNNVPLSLSKNSRDVKSALEGFLASARRGAITHRTKGFLRFLKLFSKSRLTAVGGSAKVCGSFRVPRAAKPDGPREAGGKKIKKYFRLRVDRAAAVLLKSQPAPKTVETPEATRKFDL